MLSPVASRRTRCAPILLLTAALDLGIAGCSRVTSAPAALTPDAGEAARRSAGRVATERFLEQQRPRYRQAMVRAEQYLATFDIDPVALRRRGIKGRKKLVELLDAYVALRRHAPAARRAALTERFRQVARVTARAEYHDMARVDDKQFREDATSYLRAAYLMDSLGQSSAAYRREIAALKPRLDGHLPVRGPHQRLAFAFYYRHFQLALPPLLTEPLRDAIVARRLDPERLTLSQAYDLTHEVFVPFDYGGALDARPFGEDERRYLRRTLTAQATLRLRWAQVDILGELLACLRFLGETDLPVYRAGLAALLAAQRANGSFGDYERLRVQRGALLELDAYLHTTSVVLDVLPLAFDGPRPR